MRYLASASIGGLHMRDDASSDINSSISPKENQSPGFSFFRYKMLGSQPQLQFRHSHGPLLFKVEI